MRIWTLRTKTGKVKVLRSYRGEASTGKYEEIEMKGNSEPPDRLGCQWEVFCPDKSELGSAHWFSTCTHHGRVVFSVPQSVNGGTRVNRRYCDYHAGLAKEHYGPMAKLVKEL